MTRFSRLLVVTVLASACSVEGEDEIVDDGEVTLANPDDEGKGDTVFGKILRYSVRSEWPWTAGDESLVSDATVVAQTDSTVRVRGLRFSFGIPRDELLRISVDAESFNDFGELSTDMAFILFVPSPDGTTWEPARCPQSYFESVVIDKQNREIDVVARNAAGDVARTYAFGYCGIPNTVEQVAIFAFPSSNWGNMEGYYQLKVEADCGTQPCPAGKFLY